MHNQHDTYRAAGPPGEGCVRSYGAPGWVPLAASPGAWSGLLWIPNRSQLQLRSASRLKHRTAKAAAGIEPKEKQELSRMEDA